MARVRHQPVLDTAAQHDQCTALDRDHARSGQNKLSSGGNQRCGLGHGLRVVRLSAAIIAQPFSIENTRHAQYAASPIDRCCMSTKVGTPWRGVDRSRWLVLASPEADRSIENYLAGSTG